MNLSEALDAALPEMPPARQSRTRLPRMDPNLAVREDLLDEERVYAVLQRDTGNFFRLAPDQWQLANLFDGARTFEEIAKLYETETGATIGANDVESFADNLEDANFWYKSPQERNLALSQKLTTQRSRRTEMGAKFNFAHISFSAWDPDRYLDWLDRLVGDFIYSRWCVVAVVLLFLFETIVFVEKWSVIGPDVALYYTFTNKSFQDLAQFWLLILVLGFIHESAHGLTCKHYGGQVHSMGLMFLYLAPCFYVDVTEIYISATKVQRLSTIIAGIWIEMVVCGFAMIIWANTVAGQWIHDFSYAIILITGVAVVLINMNPLIKLDGYYFLSELIGIPDLKERSTAFLTGWFQSRILGMKVETPVIARKRAPLFVLYAVASGTYSYLLLFFVIRFSYNITSKWLAEFALIPAGALAFFMFGSRLRALRGVARQFWKERFGSGVHWRPRHTAVAGLLAALLFLPIWRDRETAFYVIEPEQTETLHAAVPGRVEAVLIQQGAQVHKGQPLLRMSSITSASLQSNAESQMRGARYQAFSAQMQGSSIGSAAAKQLAATRSSGLADEADSSLWIRAAADGTVLTENPASLLAEDIGSGQSLLDIADNGHRVARVYVPASALDRIAAGAEVAIGLPGRFSVVRMKLAPLDGEAVPLPAGLVAQQAYKGIQLPVFFCSRMVLPAGAGDVMLGSSGQAKIFGERRSIAERMFTMIFNLVKNHVW